MNDVIIIHYPDSIKTLRQPPACMGISSQYYWASNTNKIQLKMQIKYKYPNKKTKNTQIRIYPNTQIQYDYPKSRHLPAWESLPSNNHLCCFSPLSTWITALQHFWIVLHIIRHFGAANPQYFKRNQRGGVSWQTSARCFVITCAFSAFSSMHISILQWGVIISCATIRANWTFSLFSFSSDIRYQFHNMTWNTGFFSLVPP